MKFSYIAPAFSFFNIQFLDESEITGTLTCFHAFYSHFSLNSTKGGVTSSPLSPPVSPSAPGSPCGAAHSPAGPP